jgi:hypothetical protein
VSCDSGFVTYNWHVNEAKHFPESSPSVPANCILLQVLQCCFSANLMVMDIQLKQSDSNVFFTKGVAKEVNLT